MSGIEIVYIVLLIIFIILSAFFSGSETAFISLQRYRLEHLVANKVPRAKSVAKILEHPERFLSTVLLGNNLVNTAAAALATTLAVSFLGAGWGAIIATIGMTIVLLIFSESIPKTIANRHAERLSLRLGRPIEMVSWLFSPFVWALSWIVSAFAKLVGGTPVPSHSLISDEEIRTMISVGHKAGTVEPAEAKLLDNVFNFGDRPVHEVMVPRTEVIWVEKGTTLGAFLELYTQYPFSRFPVYHETQDNVVGIIAIKDVLMGLAKGTLTRDKLIDEIIRPAYFTPESKRINELFTEMQLRNYHMAIIVDEYGGTAGIVSMERLLEEIVGPVGDELGGMEKEYETINEYTFQIDGSMRVEEANEELGLGLPTGEYETMAGFILHYLGHIPRSGEGLKYKDLKLVITKMQDRKIEQILLTKEKKEKESGTAAAH